MRGHPFLSLIPCKITFKKELEGQFLINYIMFLFLKFLNDQMLIWLK